MVENHVEWANRICYVMASCAGIKLSTGMAEIATRFNLM